MVEKCHFVEFIIVCTQDFCSVYAIRAGGFSAKKKRALFCHFSLHFFGISTKCYGKKGKKALLFPLYMLSGICKSTARRSNRQNENELVRRE